ncbi:uncharacterized protein LOC131255326 [Magnolia sinica]|uniref:uncharacterized protein LOC131255326 n=1 Tax=Magnolia sinica TaxID=86752 RepID=UPI002657FC7D|nr:uncharacterized protein LOC131255326 [Magnolia sinica]
MAPQLGSREKPAFCGGLETKIVMQVQMICECCRRQAMKTASAWHINVTVGPRKVSSSMMDVISTIVSCGVVHLLLGFSFFLCSSPKMISQNGWTAWIKDIHHGVISVVIEGKEQDQVVVIGEGVDAAKLVCRMKKKVGHTVLITVEEVKPKEEKKEVKKEVPKICTPYWQPYPQYVVACEPVYSCRGECSLM